MSPSVSDFKNRLRKFLDDPRADHEFHSWFAEMLMEVHQQENSELEDLAFAVRRAFSDAAEGVYTSEELRKLLIDYASTKSIEAKMIELVEAKSPASFSIFSVEVSHSASQSVPFWVSGNLVPVYSSVPSQTSTDGVIQLQEKVA